MTQCKKDILRVLKNNKKHYFIWKFGDYVLIIAHFVVKHASCDCNRFLDLPRMPYGQRVFANRGLPISITGKWFQIMIYNSYK